MRGVYDRLLKPETPKPESRFPRDFDNSEVEWKKLLVRHRFCDVDKAFRVLREFVEGPGYVHVSPRTIELARQLLPKLFDFARRLPANLQSSISNLKSCLTRTG